MSTDDNIKHHGILGQRWGFRRYQNPDGSLTAAGKRRAQQLKNEFKSLTGKKLKGKISEDENNSIKNMSDKELKDKINRLTNERTLENLINQGKPAPTPKQSFLKKAWSEVAVPAMINSGKNVLTKYLEKAAGDALKLNTKTVDPHKKLKEEAEDAQNILKKYAAERDLRNLKKKVQAESTINELLDLSPSNDKDRIIGPKGQGW